jgi:hypothetical protein
MEIYPQGMAALRAIKLAQGALFGTNEWKSRDIKERVLSRYPDAAPLPERPELDKLLAQADLGLEWMENAAEGEGAYRYKDEGRTPSFSDSRMSPRLNTESNVETEATEVSADIADARIFENKLSRADKEGAFLVLSVPPRELISAEEELMRRFALEYRNFDELLIGAMQRRAAELKADWKVVINADTATPDSRDWRNLMLLVDQAIKVVEAELSSADKTILLTYTGLLARYNRIDLLERLRDKIGFTHSKLHGLWLLIAGDEQSPLPLLDGKPIPVISVAQWARIPKAWIANAHRSNGNGSREG